ncbi:MAG: asparaginase [Proteobacteria bacterium]|nr:asparaginase [Pseudomonadota bacterium]MDA1023851.1 asparaginase [Pseudomonadota bacterium]
MDAKNPLMIEVTRGAMVESRHHGHAVVADRHGNVLHRWGEAGKIIYPRSAIKPLQALALIETGAADAYGLSDAELALATASHGATPEHTDLAAGWLERIGLGPKNLECGGHAPMDKPTADNMIRRDELPGPIHNNCSGKHAGFLTTAKHLGEPLAGYIGADHPVQRRLAAILAEMGDCDLSQAPTGTDGCGIPVYGMPLRAMATALARMADPSELSPERRAAAVRIIAAMTTHPRLVAGPGRFDTLVMEAAKGAFVVKTGAEGVYAGIIPEMGLGIALKIEDGAKRAAEVAMAAVLKHLGVLGGTEFSEASVSNAKGVGVGTVRMQEGWAE